MEDDFELLPDPIDVGSKLSEAERTRGVAAVQELVKPKQVKQGDKWPHPDCEDCGEEIPVERLEATGALTCFDCANAKEIREKKHGRR